VGTVESLALPLYPSDRTFHFLLIVRDRHRRCWTFIRGRRWPIGAASLDRPTSRTDVARSSGNRNITNTANKPEKVTANTFDFGIAGQYETLPVALDFPGGEKHGHWILSVRPDYLENFDTGARLFTVHGVALPYLAGVINDPANLVDIWCHMQGLTVDQCPNLPNFPYLAPLLDIRADGGDYQDRGNTVPQVNSNYFRLGSKFGADLYSRWFDLVVTHTYLHGFSGYYRSINYFQASFTFNFDPDKHFGITAAYNNGRVESTAMRDQSWTVALTAKF
jgi:hypothetical protein